MARIKPGDRVYHRRRDQHGTYHGRSGEQALVEFDGATEPERVSAHLIEPAAKPQHDTSPED